ncbi:MAG: hypothetical protein ACXWB2_09525 [Acidimicrobiales bacterium]
MANVTVGESRAEVVAPIEGARPRAWWRPAGIFVAVAAVVWLVVFVAAQVLPRDYLFPRPRTYPGGPLAEMWMRWDANWYREIIRHGYRYYPGVQSSVAYFPAYPLAVASIAWAFPGVPAAAITVTFLSGLGAAVLFHRWCSARMSPAAATTALLVLLVYPYAWYLYGAVYSDAFFLMLVLAAFVLVERERYWLAGVVGLVVTASRPTGIAVAIGLVLVVLERANQSRREEALVAAGPASAVEAAVGSSAGSGVIDTAAGGGAATATTTVRRDDGGGPRSPRSARFLRELRLRFDPRGLPRPAAPVLISFAGLAGWCAYLYYRFGDALLFVDAEGAWHQGAGPRTWFKYEFFTKIHLVPHSIFADSLMLHAILAVAAILVVPRVARRFGWGYAGYVLVVMGIPLLGTKDFMSCGRYLLAAFPVFAVVGFELAGAASADPPRRWPRRLWLVVSASILTVFCCWWAMGKYVS